MPPPFVSLTQPLAHHRYLPLHAISSVATILFRMPPSPHVASSLGGGEEDNRSLQLQQHQKKLSTERKKGGGDMKNHQRTFVARWRRGVNHERSYTARWRRSPDMKKVNHETRGGSTGEAPFQVLETSCN
jgi:hypothetical protein